MGMLYRCKETGDCPDKKTKEKAKKIKKKVVRDYAGTKHKGLPEKIKKKKRKKRKKRKNKKSYDILIDLVKFANYLDKNGNTKEADYLDGIIENSISTFCLDLE